MLYKNEALYREVKNRVRAGPRYTYVFKCRKEDCIESIRVRGDALKKASGFCSIHSHQKRPFESIYNRMKHSWRKCEVLMTYEESIELTKISTCAYCGGKINRVPFATVKGNFISAAYFLDKKVATGPYSKENCVVCCTECNKLKGNRFSYEEFLSLGKAIKKIKQKRELQKT